VGTAGADSGFPVYGSAILIKGLNATGFTTTDPSVTGDGLELFFMSTRSGNKNIWHSRRTSLVSDWPPPQMVDELNSDSIESNVKISEDGLKIWFYSDRDRALGTIWQATRVSLTEPFTVPIVVPETLDEGASEVAAAPNGDTTTALVSSNIDGQTQGYDILMMRRNSAKSTFGEKTTLANVNSAEDDFDPWFRPDGLLFVFHSNRLGSDDLFWAARSTLNDDFGSPTAISELNTANYPEAAPSLTSEGKRLYFASTRDGDEQLYEAVARE
jgi:Tol biopolymer transport system component